MNTDESPENLTSSQRSEDARRARTERHAAAINHAKERMGEIASMQKNAEDVAVMILEHMDVSAKVVGPISENDVNARENMPRYDGQFVPAPSAYDLTDFAVMQKLLAGPQYQQLSFERIRCYVHVNRWQKNKIGVFDIIVPTWGGAMVVDPQNYAWKTKDTWIGFRRHASGEHQKLIRAEYLPLSSDDIGDKDGKGQDLKVTDRLERDGKVTTTLGIYKWLTKEAPRFYEHAELKRDTLHEFLNATEWILDELDRVTLEDKEEIEQTNAKGEGQQYLRRLEAASDEVDLNLDGKTQAQPQPEPQAPAPATTGDQDIELG